MGNWQTRLLEGGQPDPWTKPSLLVYPFANAKASDPLPYRGGGFRSGEGNRREKMHTNILGAISPLVFKDRNCQRLPLGHSGSCSRIPA